MGDLLLILPRPLPGRHDRYPALVIYVGQARLRLEVGVFLGRGIVLALDDHVGLGPTGLHIPLAYLVVADAVTFHIVEFWMKLAARAVGM